MFSFILLDEIVSPTEKVWGSVILSEKFVALEGVAKKITRSQKDCG